MSPENQSLGFPNTGPTQTGHTAIEDGYRGLKFQIYIGSSFVAKTKALISCAVNDLGFCFRLCKKYRLFHEVAHFVQLHTLCKRQRLWRN